MLQKIKELIRGRVNYRYYKYLAARAEKTEFTQKQLKAEGYVSQFGQDKWVIEKLFPNKKEGIFVDIGANDGITFSNTYLLETIGWNGIAIEPIPEAYIKLTNSRRCVTVNGCVAPRTGKAKFRVISGYSEMLSGLVEEYDPRHIDRIKREIDSRGGGYEDVEVDCYNFNELLESNGILQVDYLSIDVEGAELKILNTIDFDRIQISVICIENNYSDYRIPKLLIKNGFEFHSIVADEFYRNKRMA